MLITLWLRMKLNIQDEYEKLWTHNAHITSSAWNFVFQVTGRSSTDHFSHSIINHCNTNYYNDLNPIAFKEHHI